MYFSDANVNFPRTPAFVADIDIFDVPYGLGIYVRGATKPVILKGGKAKPIVSHLRHRFAAGWPVDRLLAEIPDGFSAEDIGYVLRKLHAYGLLAEATPETATTTTTEPATQKQIRYWGRKLAANGYCRQPTEISDALARSRILLVGNDLLFASLFNTLTIRGFRRVQALELSCSGESAIPAEEYNAETMQTKLVRTDEEYGEFLSAFYHRLDDASFVLAAIRRYSKSVLHDLNSFCLRKGIEFIPVYEDGSAIEVGPYVLPQRSSCYHCLEIRKRSVTDAGLYDHVINGASVFGFEAGSLQGEDIASYDLAANYLAIEMTKILSGYATSSLLNSTFEYNPVDGIFQYNPVIRSSNCPECNQS